MVGAGEGDDEFARALPDAEDGHAPVLQAVVKIGVKMIALPDAEDGHAPVLRGLAFRV